MSGYEQQEWHNLNPDTPLSAERLRHIEEGIARSYEVTGPAGPPGPRSPTPDLIAGQGSPPSVVAGARPGDKWLDVNTGRIYVLR